MRFFPTIRRRTRRESGQVLVWIAVSSVALLAMVGFVVDVGHLFNAHRELQASADAAALAGAQDLPEHDDWRRTPRSRSARPTGRRTSTPT